MAAARIELKTLLLGLLAISAVEVVSAGLLPTGTANPLMVTAAVRLLELGLMVAILFYSDRGLMAVGLSKTKVARGLIRGLVWAGGFGCVVAASAGVAFLSGIDPLRFIRVPLPADTSRILQLFLVGGILAPVAEEVFFRGILYGYFRRWGIFPALFVSTFVFVFLHPVNSLAVTQTIGGVLFAAAYEIEGNLLVPITIHILGNLAIFSVAFLF
ncbi:MAG: CPBP family intramembrane glutamic endopeptidase [Desulfobacterales bacterium]